MQQMVKTDFQFPAWEYEQLARYRQFNLVIPLFTQQAQSLYWGAMVRIWGLTECAWNALINHEPLPDTERPTGVGWWDVISVRDCELAAITAQEWADNFGPQTLGEWCTAHKPSSTHLPVRCTRLARTVPDLRAFDREYGAMIRAVGR